MIVEATTKTPILLIRRVSGGLTLAVGFNPRNGRPIFLRRVATIEFGRRYATQRSITVG
jgi:hypothetical protein